MQEGRARPARDLGSQQHALVHQRLDRGSAFLRAEPKIVAQLGRGRDAEGAGRRSLRLACLGPLSRLDGGARAKALFADATNMTERQGALEQLVTLGRDAEALADFARECAALRVELGLPPAAGV